MKLKIEQLLPNPEQPRMVIDQAELESLAESIKEHGLLNPIAVEGPVNDAGTYLIIDGERRWRAHKMAGLDKIECSVRPALNGSGKQERLLLAMVANVQRSDMNPVEKGVNYSRMREMGMTYKDIERATGEGNCQIYEGILQLHPDTQRLYAERRLPVDWGVVRNLARLEPKAQVRLATRFANSGATSRYIGIALKRVLDDPSYGREKPDQAPAERVTKKRQIKEAVGGHWNMAAQLLADYGIELEERYREVAAETCRDCDLYDFASSNTCRECPAVDLLKRLNNG